MHYSCSCFILFFVDRNIDETGNQLYKSNHGPSECCYDYCKKIDGLCSSKCDVILNNNTETAIIVRNTSKDHNETKISPLNNIYNETPNIFIKLDNGTFILNDYSHMPDEKDMKCMALINITQSTQQCSISQAHVAARSSATSLNYPTSSSVISTINTYLHLLVNNYSINCIVAFLTGHHWTNLLVWNLFIALHVTKMLQLATGS